MRSFCLVVCLTLALPAAARACVTMTFSQVGGDVVLTTNGTINLTGMSFYFDANDHACIQPGLATIVAGPTTRTDTGWC